MSDRNQRRQRESRRTRGRTGGSREQHRSRQQSGVEGQQSKGQQQPRTQQSRFQQPQGQQPFQQSQGQQPVGQQPQFQQTATQQPQYGQPQGQQTQGGLAGTAGQQTWQQPTAGQFTGATNPQPMNDPTGAQQVPQHGQQQQPTSYAGAFGVGPQQTGVPQQQQIGGTMGGPGQLTSQPTQLYPEAFADHLTEESRECLDDCIDVSQVAAWCADRCLEQGPQHARCARLCNEVATLGSVSAEFLAKDAIGLPAVIDAYVEIAEQAVEELSQFDSAHTNEAEMVIDRSIQSSLDALEMF